MALRVTTFFGQAQTGWSETWWYPGDRNTLFYKRLETLAKLRADMLTTNHTVLACRITEEGAQRFTRLFLGGGGTAVDADVPAFTLPGRGKEDGAGQDIEGPPDQVRAAMHLEIIKNGQRIGLRYLAGIPDNVSLTEDPTLGIKNNKVWLSLMNKWRAELLGGGWAIKALDKTAGNPLVEVLTYRLRAAAPSLLGIVIPLTATFVATQGKGVLLQGVKMIRKGLQSPNGKWVVDGIENDEPNGVKTVWLRASEGWDPDTFLTLGKVRSEVYTYVVPSYIEPIRVGIHKRGKPFGSPVGRRPNR